MRIHNFVSDIRRTVDNALSRDSQLSVEVENLGPEESNAEVNPLPIGCPLLLVDIGRVTRDIDSVLREYDQRREDNSSVECFIEPRSCAQTSRDESSTFESRQIEALGVGDSRAEGDTRGRGYQTVVNLSKRVLTEREVSLLSKGLKFCPTPEKIDIYSLRQCETGAVERVFLHRSGRCRWGIFKLTSFSEKIKLESRKERGASARASFSFLLMILEHRINAISQEKNNRRFNIFVPMMILLSNKPIKGLQLSSWIKKLTCRRQCDN